jgi:hypothetical protein
MFDAVGDVTLSCLVGVRVAVRIARMSEAIFG